MAADKTMTREAFLAAREGRGVLPAELERVLSQCSGLQRVGAVSRESDGELTIAMPAVVREAISAYRETQAGGCVFYERGQRPADVSPRGDGADRLMFRSV